MSSSLPYFRQSLHIFLGDLLVTSSCLSNDSSLLIWLHIMISSSLHILYSQELTIFLVSCSYTTTSYSMRTYYVDFICPCTERHSSIDHTSKYRSPLPATIWHDFTVSSVSTYIYIYIYIYTYLILFSLSHPLAFFLEWRASFPWLAPSVCHHIWE